jgi:hypothetical protein
VNDLDPGDVAYGVFGGILGSYIVFPLALLLMCVILFCSAGLNSGGTVESATAICFGLD